MEAVDKGLSDEMVLAISSKIVLDDAQDIIKVSNSSISMSSISELEQFETNYNFKCADGGIREYMANLDYCANVLKIQGGIYRGHGIEKKA